MFIACIIIVIIISFLFGTYFGMLRVWHLLKRKFPEYYNKIYNDWSKR